MTQEAGAPQTPAGRATLASRTVRAKCPLFGRPARGPPARRPVRPRPYSFLSAAFRPRYLCESLPRAVCGVASSLPCTCDTTCPIPWSCFQCAVTSNGATVNSSVCRARFCRVYPEQLSFTQGGRTTFKRLRASHGSGGHFPTAAVASCVLLIGGLLPKRFLETFARLTIRVVSH